MTFTRHMRSVTRDALSTLESDGRLRAFADFIESFGILARYALGLDYIGHHRLSATSVVRSNPIAAPR